MGEFNDAIDVQKRIYYLQARNIDAKSLDIIPALQTRARWQHRVQLYEQERYTLRRIVSIIEDNKGKKSLDLIDPLDRLSATRSCSSARSTARTRSRFRSRRVRSISSAPCASRRTIPRPTGKRCKAMRCCSSATITSSATDANRGHRVYRDVWKLLSHRRAAAQALGPQRLEQVVLLHDIDPPRMYGGNPRDSRKPPSCQGTKRAPPSSSTRCRRAAAPPTLSWSPPTRPVWRTCTKPSGDKCGGSFTARATSTASRCKRTTSSYSHTFYYREADLPERDP